MYGRTGRLAVGKHRPFGRQLGPAVGIVPFGLGRGGDHHRRAVSRLREDPAHLACEAGIAGLELIFRLRTIYARQMEDEVGTGQGFGHRSGIVAKVETHGLHTSLAQVDHQVLADKPFCARDDDGHGQSSATARSPATIRRMKSSLRSRAFIPSTSSRSVL